MGTLYGGRYFGVRYFGARYFGGAVGAESHTTEWTFPTAHQVLSGGGWVNPQNIYAKDGALCEAQHNEVGTDWMLKTNGFGFDPSVIPEDAIITKVELEVKWNVSPP